MLQGFFRAGQGCCRAYIAAEGEATSQGDDTGQGRRRGKTVLTLSLERDTVKMKTSDSRFDEGVEGLFRVVEGWMEVRRGLGKASRG